MMKALGFVIFVFCLEAQAAPKSYSCQDLDKLRSRIGKKADAGDASVAAQIISSMAGRSSCLKLVKKVGAVVEVEYLDKTHVKKDVFRFSANKSLASWTRVFKGGLTDSAKF